ncbi:MAG: hypothetical protein ACXVZW_06345 [Gaiellaceae bacterium]
MARLGRQLAFVIVHAWLTKPQKRSQRPGYTFVVLAIVRGDVTRVDISQPWHAQPYYKRTWGAWGTFIGSFSRDYPRGRVPSHPWQARLDFYGKHGLMKSSPLRLASPGVRLLVIDSSGGR